MDEGFAIIKELTIEVENIVAKPKPRPVRSDKTSAGVVSTISSPANNESNSEAGKHEISAVLSSSNDKNKIETEKPSVTGGHTAEEESAYAHSEDGSTKCPHVSPRGNSLESSSPEFQSKQFDMHDLSPHAKESYSDLGGAESTISGDKFSDEPSWGAKFDNDDADSIWGFSELTQRRMIMTEGNMTFSLGLETSVSTLFEQNLQVLKVFMEQRRRAHSLTLFRVLHHTHLPSLQDSVKVKMTMPLTDLAGLIHSA